MRRAAKDLHAVVFDFDGTLAHLTIDFGLMRAAVVGLIRSRGLVDPDLEQLHVLEMVQEACRRTNGSDELGRRCAEAIEAVEVAAAAEAQLFEGVREALEDLRHAGLAVGVITRNCRQAVLTVDPELPRRVDALVTRDDTEHVKPDPRHVHQCLVEMNAAGARAAVVGDHPMDMRTAVGAGALAVGVLTGAGDHDALLAAGADVVARDVTAVAAWILEGRDGNG